MARKKSENTKGEAKRPVHEVRVGSIRATLWANGSAERGTFHNVTLSRRYMHDGVWKQSSSFGFDDLPVLEKALGLAWAWIRDERARAKAEQASTVVATPVAAE